MRRENSILVVEPDDPGSTADGRASRAAVRSPLGAPAPRPPVGPRSGWSDRLFGWMTPGKSRTGASRDRGEFPPRFSDRDAGQGPRSAGREPPDELASMTKRLINEDRYAFVLMKEAIDQIGDRDAAPAWDVLHRRMALIPGGRVPIVLCDGSNAQVEIGGFFLDRCAVRNREFQMFVQSGGYDSLEIWPQEVWPSVSRFRDRKGRPGPRDWEDGRFPSGLADHPVVGVCWYEALAYARWVGKRLPTAAEWQKAGGWPEQLSGRECNRYPWGDLFDPERANLWHTGVGRTLPVDALPGGATPNGVFQMTGNVWEWLDDPLETIPCPAGETFLPWKPMRRIIGGAFNTYFSGEATCQFITGQGEIERLDNIGFRCASSLERLRPLP